MHMADALVSPVVAGVAGAAAVALIGVASHKVKSITRDDIVPLMGVMGAFVFAAQMINFAIPATGSSGHIIGGVLLAALMGPWAAFITLTSVLIIQCVVFADGGLMALGCNIINMAATSCLVAYPLVYRPVAGKSLSKVRLAAAAVAACVVGLELGAVAVTAETCLSGVTALSTSRFLVLMTSIHLAIGLCEGIATAFVVSFVASVKPDMLYSRQPESGRSPAGHKMSRKTKAVLWTFAAVAMVFAIGFTWMASENPDGLEWSVARITGTTELGEAFVPSTAVIPDYNSTFAGVVGGVIVMVMLWCVCALLFRRKRKVA